MNNINKFAQLFKMICEKYDDKNTLGKKATQKIFYFFEREGIDLNLRYGIHFYGPYSARLDDYMHYLESDDIISIDTSGITHVITLGSEVVEEKYLSDNEVNAAKKVIDVFSKKTSMELEALATMDFVANSILGGSATDDEILDRFIQIKGKKFSDEMMSKTLGELKNLKFVA